MKYVRAIIQGKAHTKNIDEREKRAKWNLGKISYLRSFTHSQLRYIDLSGNYLKKVKLFINPLNFPRLEMIDLSNNLISNLVINVPNLKHLLASENFISRVKLYTPMLEKLILFNNRLKAVPDIPTGIKVINLSVNSIREFPKKEFPNLVSLYLESNLFEAKPFVMADLKRFKW